MSKDLLGELLLVLDEYRDWLREKQDDDPGVRKAHQEFCNVLAGWILDMEEGQ